VSQSYSSLNFRRTGDKGAWEPIAKLPANAKSYRDSGAGEKPLLSCLGGLERGEVSILKGCPRSKVRAGQCEL
jgi:hypothetical protein